jgi:uncharacterized delta-60 repeat protein
MAGDGDLDGTLFGGTIITDFFGQDDIASAVAVQTDGKIVTAGFTFQSGSNFDFALARYNADGTLDPDFSGGRIATDFFGQFDMATDVAIQDDGRIVVVGQCFESFVTDSDFAIARYNSDGNPDMTFGIGGKMTTDFFGEDDRATAVAILPNGKIVVAGSARNGVFLDFAITRYNSDGSLDANFGSAGKTVTDFNGTEDTIEDIAIQSDDKIVVAGSTFNRATKSNFAIARYKTNGDLDPSFAFGGKVTTDFFAESDNATCIDIQRDGKIVVAGNAEVIVSTFPKVTTIDFAVARYNTDGRADKSFSSDGKLTADFNGQQDGALAIAAQSDGKIIAAGLTNPPAGFFSDFGLVRYNANGNLDTSFGSGGKVVTDFLGSADSVLDIAIQRDGRIVAAGSAHDSSGLPNFALARYAGSLPTPQGSLEYLILDVNFLVGTGFLTHAEGDSLILKLDSAIRKLDKGLSASVHVQAFVNQIQSMVSSGRLASDKAAPLTNEANAVLSRIH